MNAQRLSRQLREETGGYLSQRRAVLALSVLSSGVMSLISLYQMGLLKHLPEPPADRLDTERISGSAQAYALLDTPDGVLGMGSYAATAALAAMGGQDRAEQKPWLPLALLAKAVVDVAQAARLTVREWRDYKAFCFWCLLPSAASLITLPLTLPEARAAWQQLRQKGS